MLLTEKTDVDNRYVRGKIISKGEAVEVLKENDIIYYDKNRGNGIDSDGKILWVIRDMDVVLVE